jgi:fluoride exporter
MPTFIAVAVAGAAGALCRYLLQAVIDPRASGFPWATLTVNLSGAFLLGLLFTVMAERSTVSPVLRVAITVGFLGAYTTFSTLAFETVQLLDGRDYWAAVANMAGSAVLGVVAVMGGVAVGRAW